MTSALEEITGIPSDELEAWLQGEIETPCEANLGPPGHPDRHKCDNPAEWLMRGTKPCGHIPNPESMLICQECYNHLTSGNVFRCDICNGEVLTTWIERIKA